MVKQIWHTFLYSSPMMSRPWSKNCHVRIKFLIFALSLNRSDRLCRAKITQTTRHIVVTPLIMNRISSYCVCWRFRYTLSMLTNVLQMWVLLPAVDNRVMFKGWMDLLQMRDMNSMYSFHLLRFDARVMSWAWWCCQRFKYAVIYDFRLHFWRQNCAVSCKLIGEKWHRLNSGQNFCLASETHKDGASPCVLMWSAYRELDRDNYIIRTRSSDLVV